MLALVEDRTSLVGARCVCTAMITLRNAAQSIECKRRMSVTSKG